MAIDTTKTGASAIVQSLQMGSGVDIQALAKNLAEAEAQPRIERVTDRKTQAETSISGYAAASSAVSSLKSFLDLIKDKSVVAATTVNTSSSDLRVTNSDNSLPDETYVIEVVQLAQGQYSHVDLGTEDDITALGSVTVAGQIFAIDNTTSKQELLDAINGAGLGVRAAVINQRTNTGADNWVLTLQGENGINNAFTISATDSAGSTVATTTERAATDAVIRVNGLTAYRGNNQVADLVEGMSLDLRNTQSGVRYSVQRQTDHSVVKQALSGFVSTYNDVIEVINGLGGSVNEDEPLAGSLAKDRSLLSSLKSSLSKLLDTESATASGGFGNLRDLGVGFDLDGKLVLDEAGLDALMETNGSDIITMLTANQDKQSKYANADSRGLMLQLSLDLDGLIGKDGVITARSKMAENQRTGYEDELLKLEARLQRSYARYLDQFSVMESFVQQSNDMRKYLEGQFKAMQNNKD
jgi:flagellar hook-associated protein 2